MASQRISGSEHISDRISEAVTWLAGTGHPGLLAYIWDMLQCVVPSTIHKETIQTQIPELSGVRGGCLYLCRVVRRGGTRGVFAAALCRHRRTEGRHARGKLDRIAKEDSGFVATALSSSICREPRRSTPVEAIHGARCCTGWPRRGILGRRSYSLLQGSWRSGGTWAAEGASDAGRGRFLHAEGSGDSDIHNGSASCRGQIKSWRTKVMELRLSLLEVEAVAILLELGVPFLGGLLRFPTSQDIPTKAAVV